MPKHILSEEDKALFREAVLHIKPSGSKNDPSPSKTDIYLSDSYVDEVQSETTLSYCQHSIPHKRFSDLQKGRIAWQGRLDLHGVKPEQASERLLHCELPMLGDHKNGSFYLQS